MKPKYEQIFKPIGIGNLQVKNRIVMPPMTTLYAGHNGEMTDQYVEYYAARAKGGTGLITVEGAYINSTGPQLPCSLSITDDIFIAGLSRLAGRIKLNGSVAVLQLIHAGIQSYLPETVGPSPIGRKSPGYSSSRISPRELSTEEVDRYVEDFAAAAFRAKLAGFDAVQLHGGNGYLIQQFISPLTNKRTDKYGMDRDMFAVNVVKAVKEKCGIDFPVIFRMCGDEPLYYKQLVGGITINDAKVTAVRLEEAGVDALDVTGAQGDNAHLVTPCFYVVEDEGYFFHLSKEIKKVVNVPVISGGAVDSPEVAEKAIADNILDLVYLGRQLIADPEWVNKTFENRSEDIRPCVRCCDCVDCIFRMAQVVCAVNTLNGLEYKYTLEEDIPETKSPKRIVVIGAGPGGLEFARAAALRGHRVVVIEKEKVIGGAVILAAAPSFKYQYKKLLYWFKSQLKKLGVSIITGYEAGSEELAYFNADTIVFATGSEPINPDIKGLEKTVLADDVILGRKFVGTEVIVIGGGLVGSEIALKLAKEGKKVTIVEALSQSDIALTTAGVSLLTPVDGLFDRYGVEVRMNCKIVEVLDDGVVAEDGAGQKTIIKADSVVNAVGRKPAIPEKLFREMQDSGKKIIVLGDAKSARKVKNAMHEGFNLALNV